MTFQKLCRLIFFIFPIKRDPQRTLAFFTAVIDANIFDTDPLCGKDRGEKDLFHAKTPPDRVIGSILPYVSERCKRFSVER